MCTWARLNLNILCIWDSELLLAFYTHKREYNCNQLFTKRANEEKIFFLAEKLFVALKIESEEINTQGITYTHTRWFIFDENINTETLEEEKKKKTEQAREKLIKLRMPIWILTRKLIG